MRTKSEMSAMAFAIRAHHEGPIYKCIMCGKKMLIQQMTTHVIKSCIEKKGCK